MSDDTRQRLLERVVKAHNDLPRQVRMRFAADPDLADLYFALSRVAAHDVVHRSDNSVEGWRP